jgi:hypothetical protein
VIYALFLPNFTFIVEQGKKKLLPGEEVASLNTFGLSVDQVKEAIESLTDCSAKMMSSGNINVYEDTYEGIRRALERNRQSSKSSTTGYFSAPNAPQSTSVTHNVAISDNNKWEYKWGENEAVHGPFSTAEIKAWAAQGYFSRYH